MTIGQAEEEAEDVEIRNDRTDNGQRCQTRAPVLRRQSNIRGQSHGGMSEGGRHLILTTVFQASMRHH